MRKTKRLTNKTTGKNDFNKIVPDTSVIIEGFLSRKIRNNQISVKELIFHEAVLSELESQANKKKDTGMKGLEEIKTLRLLSKKKNFRIIFKGSRPGDFEIKFAKMGEIDSIIRELAGKENATLFTADIVQAKVAKAKGVSVYLYEFTDEEKNLFFEKYFDKTTNEIIISENKPIRKKRGSPGRFKTIDVTKKRTSRSEAINFIEELVACAKSRRDSFFESEKKSSYIIQIKNYKITITRQPLSTKNEIIIRRRLENKKLDDYKLNRRIKRELSTNDRGVVVFGTLGSGKSTFLQAATSYVERNRLEVNVLQDSKDINSKSTGYNSSFVPYLETQTMLMFAKPEYVVFDELRLNVIDDFKFFKELRSAGISVIASINASNPKLLMSILHEKLNSNNVELLIDYYFWIENGRVKKIFELKQEKDKAILFDVLSKRKFLELDS